MWRGTATVLVVSAVYFALHSALANDWQAANLFGQRAADAWYRPFYLVQGAALLAVFALFIRPQPERDLYRATGAWRWALQAGQGVGVALLGWAALSVGLSHLTGSEPLAAWW
jgi:hypothetical protein